MQTRYAVIVLSAILSAFFFTNVFASVIGQTTIIYEVQSVHTSWLPSSTTGRGGFSYKYTLYIPGQTNAAFAEWHTKGATTPLTDYRWHAWVPTNGGYIDGAVKYYVRNTHESFWVTVNQENYANV